MDNPIVVSTRHVDAPRIAAHLAVLNKAAVHVRLDVYFHVLAAKRTRDRELVWHFRNPTMPDLSTRHSVRAGPRSMKVVRSSEDYAASSDPPPSRGLTAFVRMKRL